MNIIKSSVQQQCTCDACGSVLSVGPEDIKTSEMGHPYGAWYVCPICGRKNSMDGKLPRGWSRIVYKDEFIH